MRRFLLQRDIDVSGISGTGVVAEGLQFTDGRVVLRWRSATPSMIFHDSMANVETIHCHNGASWINWID